MERRRSLNMPYVLSGPLESERLLLRRYTLDDLDAFASWRSREDVTRYQDYDVQTRDEATRSLRRALDRVQMSQEGDAMVFAVERREDRQVIGDLILVFDSLEHAVAEIGWTLHPDFQGQGYATEAARTVIRLALDTIGFHRIKANLDPRNSASEALARRLGMRLEAHHIEDFWSKGEWTDSYIFALLEREWRAGANQ